MVMLFILGLAASLYCLGLAFALAARALPLYTGLSGAFLLHRLGAGAMGCCVCGFVIGAAVMLASHRLFHNAKSPMTRAFGVIVVIMPAAVAGYQLTVGLGRLVLESEVALHMLGLSGAVIVSHMAWQRLVSQPLS